MGDQKPDTRPRGEAKYFPTYGISDDLPADDAAWLGESQGDGPMMLIEVTDVCAMLRVRAELRDVAGFKVGTVEADGSYRLGSP